jgi:hypothetical protein
MVKKISFNLQDFDLRRLTDFLAYSILFYAQNGKQVFKQIIIPQFISILLTYFFYISLYGEFNLTYFLSTEGKIFLVIATLFLHVNIYNSIYQTIKIVIFNNLEIRLFKFKILLLVSSAIRFFIFLLMVGSIFFDYAFILMIFTFTVLNTYFYYIIITEAENNFLGVRLKCEFFRLIKLNFKAFLISLITRVSIILLPFFATFSIFIVYEFVKILISGKIFFFVVDRLTEFQIWFVLAFILFLVANPFQYFIMMIFHKYFYLKELDKNLEQKEYVG